MTDFRSFIRIICIIQKYKKNGTYLRKKRKKPLQNPAGDEISCVLYETVVLPVSFIINVL